LTTPFFRRGVHVEADCLGTHETNILAYHN
jgi:hypothetical protein